MQWETATPGNPRVLSAQSLRGAAKYLRAIPPLLTPAQLRTWGAETFLVVLCLTQSASFSRAPHWGGPFEGAVLRCKDSNSAPATDVRPGPGVWARRCLRATCGTNQASSSCSSKPYVVMSRRTHPKHDTAPVSLYNRHTITFCQAFDHKNCGQKNDSQTRSRCLAIIRRWPSPPVSHRQEIIVQTSSKRGGAVATAVPLLR